MAALSTELVIYDDCDRESDDAVFSFNLGESEDYLSLELTKGDDKQVISIDKTDAEALKIWVESVLIMMK